MAEEITAAAIRKGTEIFSAKNHYECFRLAPSFGYLKDAEQGFLTSLGRFVDRKEAAKIAFESGQTEKKYERLLSEDCEFSR